MIVAAMQHETLGSHNHVRWLNMCVCVCVCLLVFVCVCVGLCVCVYIHNVPETKNEIMLFSRLSIASSIMEALNVPASRMLNFQISLRQSLRSLSSHHY